MSTKLYVGNLSFSTTENDLKDLFSQFGTVESVKIITDPLSGRSKGFAFVEMSSEEEARNVAEKLNNKEVAGRNIKVEVAKPREDRPMDDRRPKRGGFGSGGRGRGGRF